MCVCVCVCVCTQEGVEEVKQEYELAQEDKKAQREKYVHMNLYNALKHTL